MPMTMEERLDHARAALRAYFKAKGEAAPDSPEDYQDTDASDLIADLLHLQKHLGFKDVESTLATACLHYEAEQEEGATDAFGSAASKLGCNEVEMAERMSDGDIAELVQSLKDVLSRFRSCLRSSAMRDHSRNSTVIRSAACNGRKQCRSVRNESANTRPSP